MKLNNIINKFKSKNDSKKELMTLKEIKVSEFPKVEFESKKLQVEIGQWLDILLSQKCYKTDSCTMYTHLPAEELIKSGIGLTEKNLELVSKTFGYLLSRMGVDQDEVCKLSGYKEEDFSFVCHLEHANKDYNFSLRYGDMLEDLPQLIINSENITEVFNYYKSKKEIIFELSNKQIKNNENESTLSQFYCQYFNSLNLKNGDYKISIYIYNPTKKEGLSNETFVLGEIDKLEQYLLSLHFPLEVNIGYLYKSICEIISTNTIDYPKIQIKVLHLDKEKNKDEVIEEINAKDGRVNKITVTKDNKRITIDEQNGWTITKNNLLISQDKDGVTTYKSDPNEENAVIVYEQIEAANRDVEEVKKLMMTYKEPKEPK